jgi:hypothetical protein
MHNLQSSSTIRPKLNLIFQLNKAHLKEKRCSESTLKVLSGFFIITIEVPLIGGGTTRITMHQ